MSVDERRPAGAASEVIGGDLPTGYDVGPTIGGLVVIDARERGRRLHDERQGRLQHDRVERRIQGACEAPAGAGVVIQVSPGQTVETSGVDYVRTYGRHLGSITVECSDPATVRRWVDAFRNGFDHGWWSHGH